MKAFVNTETKMIHLVDDGFVRPATKGATHCGRKLIHLKEMKGFAIKKWLKKEPHRFCLRCRQLTGL